MTATRGTIPQLAWMLRRDHRSGWTFLLTLLMPLCAWADALVPTAISGTVYLDANANGVRDAGEKGIADVRVTDGVGFATTGAGGSYSLKLSGDRELAVPGTQAVAVCWPEKTWPTSKRWFRLKDLADPAKVDFGLRADPDQKLPFTYLHVTDSHDWRASPYRDQHLTFNTDQKKARFVIHTGDMGLGGSDPQGLRHRGAELNEWAGKNAMPTFAAVGNHDTDSQMPEGSDEAYKGGFTACIGPLRWSFDCAGIHFVFVDIIDNRKERSDWVLAWLEKDFAAMKSGSRIVLACHYPNLDGDGSWQAFLRRHKVELVHAGHNHSYVRWPDWAAPMVTAFARSAGTALICVADARGVHIGLYCSGCSRGTRTFTHSRRCPTVFRAGVLEGAIRHLYGEVRQVSDLRLAAAGQAIPVGTDAVYVQADIDLGSSKVAGLRFGEASSPHEIAYADGHLVVDGVAFPVPIPPRDKVLKLAFFAHKDVLTVWANDCFFHETRTKFQRAVQVVPFAAGGQAVMAPLVVREVKPDPANRANRYPSGDGNSGLMRNPD